MTRMPLILVSLSPIDNHLADCWCLLRESSLTHWPPSGNTDRKPANHLRDRQRESEGKGVRQKKK